MAQDFDTSTISCLGIVRRVDNGSLRSVSGGRISSKGTPVVVVSSMATSGCCLSGGIPAISVFSTTPAVDPISRYVISCDCGSSFIASIGFIRNVSNISRVNIVMININNVSSISRIKII
eukprot:973122-Ditylum_brightwellii.AAC.1